MAFYKKIEFLMLIRVHLHPFRLPPLERFEEQKAA